MNITEVQAYRDTHEIELATKRQKATLRWASNVRQDDEIGSPTDLAKLRNDNHARFIGIYIAHSKAAHAMLKKLTESPETDQIGPSIRRKHTPGGFRVHERSITTPAIGDFKVESLIWNGQAIDSMTTRLSLSFLFPRGPHPGHPDRNRTDPIIETELGDLTYDRLDNKDQWDLYELSNRRETVSLVCEHAGVEIVPVEFEPVTVS